jgi:hypothetical protein
LLFRIFSDGGDISLDFLSLAGVIIFLARAIPLLVHEIVDLIFKFMDSAFVSFVLLPKEVRLLLPSVVLLLGRVKASFASFQFPLQVTYKSGLKDGCLGHIGARESWGRI